ncbi:MAG: hypothetical protein JRG81_13550 [Deltaproteobacteria bacterium]|nr:hypothetical protein [Deltaproteobacteria bacterium]MBW2181372.1 hypothetical protein [Deltaproteobacteria bacterium]MBW2364464.1 hypothetical protein [Deltaproteobacteria bacterium]
MKKIFQNNRSGHTLNVSETRSRTSLYDLIEAVSDELEPGEYNLVPETIQHLFDSGQARFIDGSTEIRGNA